MQVFVIIEINCILSESNITTYLGWVSQALQMLWFKRPCFWLRVFSCELSFLFCLIVEYVMFSVTHEYWWILTRVVWPALEHHLLGRIRCRLIDRYKKPSVNTAFKIHYHAGKRIFIDLLDRQTMFSCSPIKSRKQTVSSVLEKHHCRRDIYRRVNNSVDYWPICKLKAEYCVL